MRLPGLSGIASFLILAVTVAEHGEHMAENPMTILVKWVMAAFVGYMLSQQETRLKGIKFLNIGQYAAPKSFTTG